MTLFSKGHDSNPLEPWHLSKLFRWIFDKCQNCAVRILTKTVSPRGRFREVGEMSFRRREPRKSVEKREIVTTSTERFCLRDRCDLGRSQTLLSNHLGGEGETQQVTKDLNER